MLTRAKNVLLVGIALICCVPVEVGAESGYPAASAGRSLLEKHCAACHAIGKVGASPLDKAPPFRDVFRGYGRERLEFELSEGIGSRHPTMPQIQFTDDEIDIIIRFLAGI